MKLVKMTTKKLLAVGALLVAGYFVAKTLGVPGVYRGATAYPQIGIVPSVASGMSVPPNTAHPIF